MFSLKPPYPQRRSSHRRHEPQAIPSRLVPLLMQYTIFPQKSENSSIQPSFGFWFLFTIMVFDIAFFLFFLGALHCRFQLYPIIMFGLWIPSPFCVYENFVPSLLWWAYIHVRLGNGGWGFVRLEWPSNERDVTKTKGFFDHRKPPFNGAHHEHTLPHLPSAFLWVHITPIFTFCYPVMTLCRFFIFIFIFYPSLFSM